MQPTVFNRVVLAEDQDHKVLLVGSPSCHTGRAKELQSYNLSHILGANTLHRPNSGKHLSCAVTCNITTLVVEIIPKFSPVVIYEDARCMVDLADAKPCKYINIKGDNVEHKWVRDSSSVISSYWQTTDAPGGKLEMKSD